MKTLAQLDTFTRAYIECALWSSMASYEPTETVDENHDETDIAPSLLASIIEDCEAFQRDNAEDLEASGLSDEQAGHDFWLNRNGHGAGFWDRGIGEVGQRLSVASKVYGSVDLYVGDDDKIYA